MAVVVDFIFCFKRALKVKNYQQLIQRVYTKETIWWFSSHVHVHIKQHTYMLYIRTAHDVHTQRALLSESNCSFKKAIFLLYKFMYININFTILCYRNIVVSRFSNHIKAISVHIHIQDDITKPKPFSDLGLQWQRIFKVLVYPKHYWVSCLRSKFFSKKIVVIILKQMESK